MSFPGQPFYILVNNVSDRQCHLLKRMIIEHTTQRPAVIHVINQESFPLETSKIDANTFFACNEHHSESFQPFIVIHYNPSVDSELQIAGHTFVKDDDPKCLAQDWRDKF